MITGTDGKTTTSTLLYHVLHHAGKKVALISTVAAYIGKEQIDTGFHVTNPSPWQLQKLLKEIVDKKFTHVVLETTSHGIYQFRNWGITPTFAGITNITNEHLDYHVNYQEYVKAKASLLTQSELAIIPEKDQSTELLKNYLTEHNVKFITYPQSIESLPEEVQSAIQHRFPEPYNQSNASLVTTLAQQMDTSVDDIAEATKTFPGVPGRMQEVPNTKKLRIIVDFAHTPNALKQALIALRKNMKPTQKLIAIYGCASERDPGKRAPMGKYGAQLADYCIFTAEDPRHEDVWKIIREMKEQLTEGHAKIHSIPDRQTAIDFAIHNLAKSGDTIGIFGKGHEQSMNYRGVEYPWSDVEAVKQSLTK